MRYSPACTKGLLPLVVAILAGCAAPSAQRGAARPASDTITAAELEHNPDQDLFAFIQRVRPAWLQTRAPVSARSASEIVIVVDGVPQEPGLAPLRGFKVGDVRELSRLGASDATTRFGTGMTAGAILVVTRR